MRQPIPFRESFRYALQGIQRAYRTQRNFRTQTTLGVGAGLGACLLALSPLEVALIVVSIVMVLGAELLNTAIEAAVDLTTFEPHPLAKIAKDVAAGAVLVFSAGAAIVGVILLVDKLQPLALRAGGWRWALGLAGLVGLGRLALHLVSEKEASAEDPASAEGPGKGPEGRLEGGPTPR